MMVVHEYKFILISIIIAALFSGCGLHAPLSESAIFDEKMPLTTDFKSIFRSSGHGRSISKSFYNNNFEKSFLKNHPNIADSSLNPLWQFGIATYPILIHPNDRFTFGISLGLIFNAGFDVNYHIGDEYYFTGVANALLNAEVILQKKMIDTKILQGSLGVCYRNEKQEFRNSIFSHRNTTYKFNTEMFGLRYVMDIKAGESRFRIIAGMYMENRYNTAIVNVGISYNRLFYRYSPWD